MPDTAGSESHPIFLEAIAAEIDSYVGQAGWDTRPTLFALVPTRTLAADPAAAPLLGDDVPDPSEIAETALTPVAQDELPEGDLDEVLAGIAWPTEVVGCAVSQEIVMLPPSAENDLATDGADAVQAAAAHPDRREARLVVVVLRDGQEAHLLRLRGLGGQGDDLLTGADLAPNLAAALAATLQD